LKIILSRKGFDSSAGGYPSLIFPDGSLFSIPIPSSKDDIFYSDLTVDHEGESIQSILNDITGNRICANKHWNTCDYMVSEQRCHYDPMPIREESSIALGQAGRAESHLRKQGLDVGDIFLFYGWFKQVEKKDGRWVYKANAEDIHLIWAWMSVGGIMNLDNIQQRKMVSVQYPFLAAHPHLSEWRNAPNRIYLSQDGGLFRYSDLRCLTDCEEYQGRSTWRLPKCFNQPQAFTYLKNFSQCGEQVIIRYQGYGQEFVLDLDKVVSTEERASILKSVDAIIHS
jgi:hypothetical protein